MKNIFFIPTASGTQEFAVVRQTANEVVFLQNDIEKKIRILQQTDSQWVLQDEDLREFTVTIAKTAKQIFAKCEENSFAFECHDEKAMRRQSALSQRATNSGNVMAPMPGRIVKIEVAEGQEVAVGEGLIVVEAMKMENEFKALKAGIVQKIHVQVGQAVEAKTLLMEIV